MLREQVDRLALGLCSHGWDLRVQLNAWRGSHARKDGNPAGAFLSIFVNGQDTTMPASPGGYGLRFYVDELFDPNGTWPGSPGTCVAAIMRDLPRHVDRLLAHFYLYPGPET